MSPASTRELRTGLSERPPAAQLQDGVAASCADTPGRAERGSQVQWFDPIL